jgi:hypothetical protein
MIRLPGGDSDRGGANRIGGRDRGRARQGGFHDPGAGRGAGGRAMGDITGILLDFGTNRAQDLGTVPVIAADR